MATKAAAPAYSKPSRRGSKMTLGLSGNPMVAIGFRMAPLVPSGSGRLSGHNVCATHQVRVHTESVCDDCGGACETVLAYEWDGKVVEIDKDALGAAADKRLVLQALVEPASIDPLYFEKAYALWPEDGQESAFDLLAAALRETGKAAVGTAVLNKATKAVVVRWSELAGCLVAHACTYDARIGWADVWRIRDGIAEREQPGGAQAAEAGGLFEDSLDERFDFDAVEDEYGNELEAAVAAAAQGVTAPARPKAEEPTPVVDLMAALRASVEETKPKQRKKVAA